MFPVNGELASKVERMEMSMAFTLKLVVRLLP